MAPIRRRRGRGQRAGAPGRGTPVTGRQNAPRVAQVHPLQPENVGLKPIMRRARIADHGVALRRQLAPQRRGDVDVLVGGVADLHEDGVKLGADRIEPDGIRHLRPHIQVPLLHGGLDGGAPRQGRDQDQADGRDGWLVHGDDLPRVDGKPGRAVA